MRIRVGCEFDYDSEGNVPMLMLVRVRPQGDHQVLYESRYTQPEIALTEYIDSFGNACWRFTAPNGPLRVRYDAVVSLPGEPDLVKPDALLVPVEDLPDVTLQFTLASRYIQSDLLITRAWELFGSTRPGWERVQAVCDWVYDNIRYEAGSSNPNITALDVLERGIGVCRDFALLATGFCRALNIPARYTFGYLPDIAVEPPDVPMDFHAWFEAFLGNRWYAFDARHNTPRIGRIVVGRGRDAVDVALTTQFGSSQLVNMTVWADQVLEGSLRTDAFADADALEAADAVTSGSARL
ncbi:MAG: transglutaminase family protein [Chloroflexota bacterium]